MLEQIIWVMWFCDFVKLPAKNVPQCMVIYVKNWLKKKQNHPTFMEFLMVIKKKGLKK